MGLFNGEHENARFHGFYRGEVMDNQDPKQSGRIKLSIHGVLQGIDTASLPWAIAASPTFVGAGSGSGRFMVPDIGTIMWCFFEEGDHNQPVYFAEAPDCVHGLPEERTTNYPKRRVLKTSAGVVIYIDDETTDVRVNHPSGTFVEIDKDGHVRIHGGNVRIDGADIDVEGNTIDLTAGNIKMTAGGIQIIGPLDVN